MQALIEIKMFLLASLQKLAPEATQLHLDMILLVVVVALVLLLISMVSTRRAKEMIALKNLKTTHEVDKIVSKVLADARAESKNLTEEAFKKGSSDANFKAKIEIEQARKELEQFVQASKRELGTARVIETLALDNETTKEMYQKLKDQAEAVIDGMKLK